MARLQRGGQGIRVIADLMNINIITKGVEL
jgi:hypothetical protein